MKPTPPATGAGSDPANRSTKAGRNRRLRRLAAVALAILAILAIAWCGYWLLLTSRLEAGVQQWIAERRAQGYGVGYAAIESGGFPRWARVVVTNPALAMPANAAPLAWSASRLVVGVDPFHPRRVRVDVPGAHVLGVGTGPDQARYGAEAGQFTVMAELGEAAPASVLTVRDLALRPLAGDASGPGSETRGALTVARLDARGRGAPSDGEDATDGGYRAVVDAAKIALPGQPDLPLGNIVESLAAEATVQGEMALQPWPEALFRWRDAGGVIDVAALKLAYGPLSLSGSGTVALDEAGQPVAAFAAQISGLFPAIDAMRAHGHMGRGEAVAAKLALGLLAGPPDRRSPPDRQGPLDVPLTLQDRVLSVGPVALMPIPEVYWLPAPAARHP